MGRYLGLELLVAIIVIVAMLAYIRWSLWKAQRQAEIKRLDEDIQRTEESSKEAHKNGNAR